MKKLFFVLASVLVLSTSQAYAFQVQAHAEVNRVVAKFRVYNNYGRAIMCTGSAYGLTVSGYQYYAYFNNVIIYPGQFAYAEAFTNVYDVFIGADSRVNCQFL